MAKKNKSSMEEKYVRLFEIIEEWVIDNPENTVGSAMCSLIAFAREYPEEAKNCYKAIQMLSKTFESWPICRCGREH
tara:strand:+ start:396 stop:626 length:231 start_codon:yes stop_codon:yes gene_type:complete